MKTLVAVAIAMAAFAAAAAFAAQPAHDHHSAESSAALQLDAGKKWPTDAPLRKGMGEIRRAMTAALQPIHRNTLPAGQYAALAKDVEASVAGIVAQCKLAPAADAQLHLVVTDLLAGAGQMAGQAKAGQPRDGALRVVQALDNYGKYFDDPGFKPLSH